MTATKSKAERQKAILEIIRSQDILTQGELTEALLLRGFDVTQATISRDMRELQLYKSKSASSAYRYDAPQEEEGHAESDTTMTRLHRILTESVISVDSAGNLVVIKTMSAMANGACEAIDSMEWPEVIGTLAGENTILLVVRDVESVQAVADRVRELIK